jgi:hypothetical protein
MVEVRGPAEQAHSALRSLEGVTQANIDSKSDGTAVFTLFTKDNRDLRDKVAALIIEKGWALLQLGYRRRTLEDAFFEVLRAHNPLKDAADARTGGSTAIQNQSGQVGASAGS